LGVFLSWDIDANHGAMVLEYESQHLPRIYHPNVGKYTIFINICPENQSPSFVGFYIPAPWFASGIWIMDDNGGNL
jgi:hypothetical protein